MIAAAIDVILGLVLVEALALVLLHRRTGRGVAPARLLPNLAAGFLLMLAVRLALGAGAGESLIALCLIGSLAAHLLDLRARWGR